MDIAWSSPLSPQEKLFITSTESWARYLNACLKSCRGELERRTNEQIRDNRRVMDRRARKAFEDEPKGPSKFAGRRAEHRTQDTLRWRVPVGLQWVEWHDGTWDDTWKERLTLLQETCPGIKAHHIVGDACVGRLQVRAHEEAEMQDLITAAGEKWEDRTAVRNKTALARKIGELAAKWKLVPGDNTRLEQTMATAVDELTERSNEVQEEARIGSRGLWGSRERRWVVVGSRAREEMEEWMQHLATDARRMSPFQLQWAHQHPVLSHSDTGWSAEISYDGAEVR